jgi:hypothetical protein
MGCNEDEIRRKMMKELNSVFEEEAKDVKDYEEQEEEPPLGLQNQSQYHWPDPDTKDRLMKIN